VKTNVAGSNTSSDGQGGTGQLKTRNPLGKNFKRRVRDQCIQKKIDGEKFIDVGGPKFSCENQKNGERQRDQLREAQEGGKRSFPRQEEEKKGDSIRAKRSKKLGGKDCTAQKERARNTWDGRKGQQKDL